jgi:hypothetical protein
MKNEDEISNQKEQEIRKENNFSTCFSSLLDDAQGGNILENDNEVSRYLFQTCKTKDVLSWWGIHQSEFPNIAKLARKYLSIPASSAPSERICSSAGNVINEKRTNLSCENADVLIFLHDNLNKKTVDQEIL